MLLNIRKFFDFGGLERQLRDGFGKKKAWGYLGHELCSRAHRTPTPLDK